MWRGFNLFMNDLTMDKIFAIILILLGSSLLALGVNPLIEVYFLYDELEVDASTGYKSMAVIHGILIGTGIITLVIGVVMAVRSVSDKRLKSLDEDELG
jgi:hypothetical protein